MKNPGVPRDKRSSSTEIIKILEDDGWKLWNIWKQAGLL